MKTILATILSVAALVVLGDESQSEAEAYAKYGGMFRLKGKGTVAVIDCRAQPNAADYAAGRSSIERTFYLDIAHRKGEPFAIANAKEQLKASGANAAVFIADDPALPMSLSASEESWAMLNSATISADKPDAKTYAHRLSVLFVRQFCRALGSDECIGTEAAFHTILSVKDIDDVKLLDITFGPEMGINQTLVRRGLEIIEIGTYEDACQQGIAPPPTNDIQKAIWEKVHAPPKTPMKIKYDGKAKKPVITK